ncbi:M36 family metallopeptidase [Myxococcus stipitatus]|uniref:M36 family metallopeptidase n=1 Tax=Myxococcus stipitatus TaxID=83455 RepID=UPI00146A5640|nr:M36 family metallopeptidase [Myxococcus stipitatus]
MAHAQERLGVPSFAWVETSPGAASLRTVSRSPEQAAREVLERYAPAYGLERTDAEHAPVSGKHRLREGGGIITFGQQVDGVEVFGQSMKVLLDARQLPVAVSGHLSPVASSARYARGAVFRLEPREAIAAAYRDLEGHVLPIQGLVDTGQVQGRYRSFVLSPGPRTVTLARPTRTKPIYYAMPDALVPAYYVELSTVPMEGEPSGLYAYAIAADDGRLLYRHSLVQDSGAFTYKVWADAEAPYLPWDGPQGLTATPHPTGLPDGYQAPFVEPNRVTLRNAPFSRNDPWLPPDATRTQGNNVEAFADLVEPDGYSEGDLHATVTQAATFDHGYDHRYSPTVTDEQVMATVTHAFYVTNFLHDWYYDSGFDEAAGNAQGANFGRGGLEGDSMLVEAQNPFEMRNNAWMETPADGARPRMTVLLNDYRGENALTVTTAAGTQESFALGYADFGPQTFDLTRVAVMGVDGVTGPEGTPTDGCEPLVNGAEVQGKVVLLDASRTCGRALKALHAQQAGAAGVLVLTPWRRNGSEGTPGRMSTLAIPLVSVNVDATRRLRAALSEGETTLRLFRGGPARDIALDTGILTHEWMHYLSNRLIGNGNGLNNNQGRSMGEGWSDFGAMMLLAREEDAQLPSNPSFSGAYAVAGYALGGVAQSYYWGWRRYPYSTNPSKNPLTFRHIQFGVPLPEGIPINPEALEFPINSEAHSSGEVWASLLWECFVALVRDSERLSFEQARTRMKDYLVASLELTPHAPTFLEARDALLAVARVRDSRDFELFAQAFAKRGAGLRAVAPHRDSLDHVGVVESFDSGKDLSFVRAELLPGARSCDDDGVLDPGEQALVRITLRNSGTARLQRSSVRVASEPEGLVFPSGTQWTIPPSEPFQQVSVEVPVSMAGGTSPRRYFLKMAFKDEDQTLPGEQLASLPLWVSQDESPATSRTETVETDTLPWSFEQSPPGLEYPWRRELRSEEGNHLFHAPNLGMGPGLRMLVSPPLQVATDQPFRFAFRHRHDLEMLEDELTPRMYMDGAVLELSADDGRTWTDIGEWATPTYNAVIEDEWEYENPLAHRPVYGGKNHAYPALEPVSVDLGMRYAGQTVRVRFVYGSDWIDSYFITPNGWDVDDLQFEGIVNTPFTAVVADAGLCLNHAPTAEAKARESVPEGHPVTLRGEGHDADGDALTYAWTQTAGPSVTLSDAAASSPRFTAPRVSKDTTLTFQLVVSDGKAASPPATVSVRVRNLGPEGCADGGAWMWLAAALGLAFQRRRPG